MHIPVLYDFVQRLARRITVTVYSLSPPDMKVTNAFCGKAHVRYLPAHHQGGTVKKILKLLHACLSDNRTEHFDLVHGFWAIPAGIAAGLGAKGITCPGIVTFMGGETARLPDIPYGNLARFLPRQGTKWVAERADALVMLSEHQIDALAENGWKGPRVRVIPFGVDCRSFVPAAKVIGALPLRLLHVSHLNPLKDQTTLLKAFALVNQALDARLRIVGGDQMGGAIQKLASALGVMDKIEFAGIVPHSRMPEQYAWAHLLVHTSLHEAGVLVAVEAAASGVPVVGSHTGLIADMDGQWSVTNELRDHQALAQNIVTLAAQPSRYNSLRQAAINWAMAHDNDWTVEQYVQLYRDTIDHSTQRLG
jgi:glycosyltransferase involved in cell wall biosynthesis